MVISLEGNISTNNVNMFDVVLVLSGRTGEEKVQVILLSAEHGATDCLEGFTIMLHMLI